MRCPALSELPLPPANEAGWPWTEDSPQPHNMMPDGSPWPRVSIVTPSYNQAQFIEETIRSVLLQGYPDLEYIIIDGGSTDGSVDIIRKYEPWLAYWISEPDKGQADAINKGFERSTGQFLSWINSDDYFYPGFVHRTIVAFQARPEVDFLYSDVDVAWGTGGQKTRRYGESLPFEERLRTMRMRIPQQSSMWRRSVVERVGVLDPRWHVVLDREFFVRVGLECKMEYLPGAVALFRHHSQSKSISEKRQWITEMPIMYQEFFEREDLPGGILALKNETMSAAYMFCARYAYDCDGLVMYLKYVLKAVKAFPRLLLQVDFYLALGKNVVLAMLEIWKKRQV
jgi:glycosyltransferase involved in cell wall biosynthesis